MYKKGSGQLSLSDFGQPVGMRLKPENRWVKKAQRIPWDEIENRYAELFKNRKGNVAKPLRLALGALIIQAEYGYSDEETALQIQETAYLQYFCGYREYDDGKPPFDPSLMVYFRKRLTPEILGEINELIIQRAEAPKEDKDNRDDTDDDPPNSGTLIMDATCAPSEIRYPTDTSLLNEARENSETIIDLLHDPSNGDKPRTYRKKAHKEYVRFVRNRKPGQKKIRKCIRKQLGYLGRNLMNIEKMLASGAALPHRLQERLQTIRIVSEQQRQMYDNKVHRVENRIVSISKPFLRPIVRGKAKSPVEFGAKLDISVADGYTRLETFSFDSYNEATLLGEIVQRYRDRTGHYPQRILADKIYRNRENLSFCKEHNIRLSGPALGRPKKDAVVDKQQEYADICDRVEVERKISLAKRKCGLGLLTTRLAQTTASVIALSIVVLNLRKIQCVLSQWWQFFARFPLKIWSCRNLGFVQ
jgi:hypothetical protein